MASTRLKETKDGKKYYEIRVRMGRDKDELSTRWYVPDGWSDWAIGRKLNAVAAEFERKCKAGEVKTKKQIRAEQEAKALEEAKIPTFKNYVENVYLPAKSNSYKKNTISGYYTVLEAHVYDTIGAIKMPDITDIQISSILHNLQEKGYKVSSRLRVYSVIRAVFRYAYKKGHIDYNPMERVDRPVATDSEEVSTEVKAFNEKEIEYILKCANNEPLLWKTMIYFLVFSGCRVGEAAGLRWKCVDFEHGCITIDQTLCINAQFGVYANKPKNKKIRTVYLDPKVMGLLAELKEAQKGNILSFSKDEPFSDYVFAKKGYKYEAHPKTPYVYLKKFGEQYGIEDLHPHKLRHSFASIAIKNGADIISVAAMLGDNPETILRVYAHDYEEGKRRTANVFSNAIAINL